MPDYNCRITKLEEKLEKIDQFEQLLHEIREGQQNQKGFIRGVTFSVSAIVGAIGLLSQYIDFKGF